MFRNHLARLYVPQEEKDSVLKQNVPEINRDTIDSSCLFLACVRKAKPQDLTKTPRACIATCVPRAVAWCTFPTGCVCTDPSVPQSSSDPSNPIESNPIDSNRILSYPIDSNRILSYPIAILYSDR
jgi:hypothetical protein